MSAEFVPNNTGKTSHLWLIINLVSCLLKLSYLSDNVGYLKADLIKNRLVTVDMSCDVSWILKIRWGRTDYEK